VGAVRRPPPSNGRHRAGEGANDDHADVDLQMSYKMEFLKYDGVGDPLSWLNRCEPFFRVRHMPDHKV
jgi:hypothetical protein